MIKKNALSLFLSDLKKVIPKNRIYTDSLRCSAYAHDASPYLLIPKAIIKVENETEVIACLTAANTYTLPLTFRAAGTSLSGQAGTDSILIMLGETWREHKVLAQGQFIYLEPGVIGSEANLYLLPYRRKIGPDPASLHAAKIGGIAANNASGMCCGIQHNTYHTMQGMRLILADGSLLDTHASYSIEKFRLSHAPLLASLLQLREQIHQNADLKNLILQQYKIKNTLGYSLNAFLDYHDPIDILTHLMIGSEGTLGFIAGISYRTLPLPAYQAATLLFFDSLESACTAVLSLPLHLISALELMDKAALKTGNIQEYGAALLLDLKADHPAHLSAKIALIQLIIDKKINLAAPAYFVSERQAYHDLWRLRKGILPTFAGTRQTGQALINEDVAVPLQAFPAFSKALHRLLKTHHYLNTCIFGHAKEGNLHFLMEADLHSAPGIQQYKTFMEDLTTLVLKHQGALKAEHGTGRNMAPFLEQAWGKDACQIMREVKALLDPAGILNPDVILSQNPHLHLEHLKSFPSVDPRVDACIECGFCERVCPSKNLSLSPRGRIAALRDSKHIGKLSPAFQYQGIDSCAKTGLCALHCPVGINTGELMGLMLEKTRKPWQKWLAQKCARHFSFSTACVRLLRRFLK